MDALDYYNEDSIKSISEAFSKYNKLEQDFKCERSYYPRFAAITLKLLYNYSVFSESSTVVIFYIII